MNMVKILKNKLANIYDGAFLEKYLTSNRQLFSQKHVLS